MTYEEAVAAIHSLLPFGVKPGLDRIRELTDRLGAKDRVLKFVHVAGTNGKGSTCTLMAAALTKAGYRTGLFISPYVLDFRERISVDGEMIPRDALAGIVERILPVVKQMNAEGKIITEFELVFVVALEWFVQTECSVVVLETGLGGRFDATNIIDCPLVSVITSISLDHTHILGDTYEQIAFEKCGIMKDGGDTVVYGEQEKTAMAMIRRRAGESRTRLWTALPEKATVLSSDIHGTFFDTVYMGEPLHCFLKMIGAHQVKNAVTALTALEVLKEKGFPVPAEAVREAFAAVCFPARLEVLGKDPLILLDGAHNPDGAAALGAAVRQYLSGKTIVGIVGMLADKDVDRSLKEVLPLLQEVIAVEPDNPRKMTAEELAEAAKPLCPLVSPGKDLLSAYREARQKAGPSGVVLVFGSLYLASAVRPIILSETSE